MPERFYGAGFANALDAQCAGVAFRFGTLYGTAPMTRDTLFGLVGFVGINASLAGLTAGAILRETASFTLLIYPSIASFCISLVALCVYCLSDEGKSEERAITK